MPLAGHVYNVTNPLEAFLPVIRGDAPPTSGFEPPVVVPWARSTVRARYYLEWGWPYGRFLPVTSGETAPWHRATVAPDGSFSLADPPPAVVESGFPVWVSLSVTSGVPIYRSERIPLDEAQFKELNLWLYVANKNSISARTISEQLAGQGLPDSTTISAGGPYGLHFSGSASGVSVDLDVGIAADTSPNLDDFLDLSITRLDINVHWPASAVTTADDVLNRIESGIPAAGSKINQAVLQRMQDILQKPLPEGAGLSAPEAADFLSDVSVTFYDIEYPVSHSWGIADTSDDTTVLLVGPCLGFPRGTLPLRFSTHP